MQVYKSFYNKRGITARKRKDKTCISLFDVFQVRKERLRSERLQL